MVPITANIILTYSLAIFVLVHQIKYQGVYRAFIVFLGVSIIASGLENLSIIFEAYYYTNSNITWLWGHCPFEVTAGWYIIFYCALFMSHSLLFSFESSLFSIGQGTKPVSMDRLFIKITALRAGLAGFIALGLDWIMDPAAVANQWWIWQVHNIYIMGVPLSNFFGWWMLIFATAFCHDIVFTYCGMNQKTSTFTSGLWIAGIVCSAVSASLLINGSTHLWGMDAIRTKGIATKQLNNNLNPDQFMDIANTIFIILTLMVCIMMVSILFKVKKFSARPKGIFYDIIPPLTMLVFWCWMMGVALISDLSLFSPGLVLGIPYIVLCMASLTFILKLNRKTDQVNQ